MSGSLGLQWLRKAIVRAAGLKSLHDEEAIFAREADRARAADGGRSADQWRAGATGAVDGYALTIAFKGVLLEGLEVAFIVVTFGSSQHDLGLAAIAAPAAVLVVVAAGVSVRGPLARVPENTMKFAVGVLLSSFGVFWLGEGSGAHWPGGDASLLALIPGTAVLGLLLVARLRPGSYTTGPEATISPAHSTGTSRPLEPERT